MTTTRSFATFTVRVGQGGPVWVRFGSFHDKHKRVLGTWIAFRNARVETGSRTKVNPRQFEKAGPPAGSSTINAVAREETALPLGRRAAKPMMDLQATEDCPICRRAFWSACLAAAVCRHLDRPVARRITIAIIANHRHPAPSAL